MAIKRLKLVFLGKFSVTPWTTLVIIFQMLLRIKRKILKNGKNVAVHACIKAVLLTNGRTKVWSPRELILERKKIVPRKIGKIGNVVAKKQYAQERTEILYVHGTHPLPNSDQSRFSKLERSMVHSRSMIRCGTDNMYHYVRYLEPDLFLVFNFNKFSTTVKLTTSYFKDIWQQPMDDWYSAFSFIPWSRRKNQIGFLIRMFPSFRLLWFLMHNRIQNWKLINTLSK